MSEGFHMDDQDYSVWANHVRKLNQMWFRGFWQGNVTGFCISVALVLLIAWFANPL